jgi:hypothetical protein
MFTAILLKEYIKLRAFWLVALAFNLCVVVYIYVAMRKLFMMDHAEIVWYRVIHLGTAFYDPFLYVPVATGLFLAAAQFFPEMKSQRFRITLHLPMEPQLLVLGHLLVGLGAVVVISAVDLLALGIMTSMRFPAEVVSRTLLTALPWTLAGLTAYIGTTIVLLEPTWRMRIFNALVAAGITGLFLRQGDPGAYGPLLPTLFLIVFFFVPSVLLPAYRFRYRRVS